MLLAWTAEADDCVSRDSTSENNKERCTVKNGSGNSRDLYVIVETVSGYSDLTITCRIAATSSQSGSGSSGGGGGGACFSESTGVVVKDKGLITMSDLVIGDDLLSKDGEFESFHDFGHYHPIVEEMEFFQVFHNDNAVRVFGLCCLGAFLVSLLFLHQSKKKMTMS